MEYVKKFFKVSASSMLESVMALTIVSICLFVTLMVYASVYSPKKSYISVAKQNNQENYFYYLQLQSDTLDNHYLELPSQESEFLTKYLKKVTVEFNDSLYGSSTQTYYITTDEK